MEREERQRGPFRVQSGFTHQALKHPSQLPISGFEYMAAETKVSDSLIRPIDTGSFPLDSELERYKKGATDIELDSSSQAEDALYF
ncbi:MAG: hypothetical protein JSW05_07975, partial [Candidatus Thorarchaeota archaeon]